ncbi:MAG: 50S ribosomal protein L24 [Victivallales bacterium]|jgi:large subunit ribosomal protein L24|nr:50S ribosomal protein L24 [Victivallales bacterium]MBR4519001.1 50S ribosomal protein L24 [Victivallales bacterium]
MAKVSIKKNDTVFVISGAERGKSGKVLRVDRKAGRVYVQGLNMQKKTVRRSQEKPQGGIMDVEGPIHISNVMHEDRYRARRQAASATSEKQS